LSGPALRGVSAAVAAACGVPDPPAPAGELDWDAFVRLVDRHQVGTLVHRSGWLDRAAAPESVRDALGRRARADALRWLRLAGLQRDVLRALAAAEVDAVVLKGATTALDAHGDPGARSPGDVDVLVRRESVPTAVRALRSAGLDWYGWRPPEDPDRRPVGPDAVGRLSHLPMLRDVTLQRDGIQVEVHWRLFPNTRLMPVDPDWLARPRRLRMHEIEVPALPLAAQWLYVLVHGSNHLWSRMKWLADVAALAARHPQLVDPGALSAAGAGYRRPLATGLLVAEATFGRLLPAETRAWALGVGGTGLLVARSVSALRGEHDLPRRVTARAMPGEVMGRLALRRDVRYRLDELRLLLLSAGRAQGVEDPGLAELASGPLRWVGRTARRAVGR
jgi:hypothetical protein